MGNQSQGIKTTGGSRLQRGTTSSGREAIVTPRPDQFEDLHRLDRDSFPKAESYTYFYLRQLFDVFRRDFMVLARDDRLLGYVLTVRNSSEDLATIMSLCVAPDLRGHGYGRTLLSAAAQHAHDLGAKRVTLMVKPDNDPAVRLYREFGFVLVQRHPAHFGPGQDRDEMRLELT